MTGIDRDTPLGYSTLKTGNGFGDGDLGNGGGSNSVSFHERAGNGPAYSLHITGSSERPPETEEL